MIGASPDSPAARSASDSPAIIIRHATIVTMATLSYEMAGSFRLEGTRNLAVTTGSSMRLADICCQASFKRTYICAKRCFADRPMTCRCSNG